MKSTNNNRGKMKRKKKLIQPKTFWNIGIQPRKKLIKPQKIVLIKAPANVGTKNKNKPFNFGLEKQSSFSPKVNKQKWGVSSKPIKIKTLQVPKQKRTNTTVSFMRTEQRRIKDTGFIPHTENKVPQHTFAVDTTSSKISNLAYLYGAVPKRKEIDREPMKIFVPIQMTPSPIFKKETTYQEALSPWGDADMDGSVNHMDCDPREVARDGILQDIAGGVARFGRKLIGKENEEDRERKAKKFAETEVISRKVISEDRALRKDYGEAAVEEARKIAREKGLKLNKEQRESIFKKAKEDFQTRQDEKNIAVRSTKEIRRKNVIEKVSDIMKQRATTPLMSSKKLRLRELDKDIKKLNLKNKSTYILRQKRDKLQKSIEADRSQRIGGILSATTPLGSVPEIRKISKRKSGKSSGESKGRGRPSGPSGKYVVDGAPVFESEYQQIRAIENQKRKEMGMEKISTKSFTLNTIKQAVPRQQAPQTVAQRYEEDVPQAVAQRYEEDVPEPRQAVEVGPPLQQGTILQQQMREQYDDNILKAPNINKGELNQTAGVFQEDPRYNILNAPDVNKGGMRNVGATEEKPAVQLGERPNPNPYGNEYTEVDPGSGRVMVKRRPQEKWATGEAL